MAGEQADADAARRKRKGLLPWEEEHRTPKAGKWVALPYAANWSDFSTGEGAGQYRKDALGMVEVAGLAKKSAALGALPETVAVLPAGFRPTRVKRFSTVSSAGYAHIAIDSAGLVEIVAGGGATYTGFDGIRFDPAT